MKDPSVFSVGSDKPSTSSSLVRRLQNRENEAWSRCVQLYGPMVYVWSRRRNLSEHDSSEIVQEVFRAVARKVGEFHREGTGSFRGWLWTITQNKIRDWRRRQMNRPVAEGGSDAQQLIQQVPDDGEPEMASEASDRVLLVRGVLDRIRAEFEPRTWRAFWLTTVENRAPADVADELGMSANAAYVAKSRVMRRLREELSELEP